MPEATQSPHCLRFGVFELDLRGGELRKRGLKVRLQERPFQILTFLLENRGEVVTREELRKRLWPEDTFVDFDHSVNTAINKLRDALGETAENPRFIETLPRHGYRFIGAVDSGADVRNGRESVTPPARRERRRWLAVVAAAAVAAMVVFGTLFALNVAGLRGRLLSSVGASHGVPLLKIESIAVLPLENLSGDPQQEYFADGMTDELITTLGQISALRVISRTSVMQYKRTKKPLPEIARELNVDAIVEGTVRRSGDRVRITAQLIDARDDHHLWAQAYERNLGDLLMLQSEVARTIASQVKIKLTPQEHVRLAGSRPVNPQAYDDYLKGMQQWYRLSPQDLDTALQYFKLALKKDPNYAPAHSGVALVWIGRQQMGYTAPREAGPKAKAAALKAVELDSTLAQAHSSLATVNGFYEWDWAGAEAQFKRAIELNPNYPDGRAFYSHYLMCMKRPEEAMAQIQRALELDPLNDFYQAFYAVDLELAGRYDGAIPEFRKALRTSPEIPFAHWGLGDALSMKGLYDEALAEFKASYDYSGFRELGEALTQGYAQSGYRGAMKRAADMLAERGRKSHVPTCDVAGLYLRAGEKAQALAWLEKGLEVRDPCMPYINVDQNFGTLRSDPRFQAILRRMNFPK